jgi:hypothetical protein
MAHGTCYIHLCLVKAKLGFWTVLYALIGIPFKLVD